MCVFIVTRNNEVPASVNMMIQVKYKCSKQVRLSPDPRKHDHNQQHNWIPKLDMDWTWKSLCVGGHQKYVNRSCE